MLVNRSKPRIDDMAAEVLDLGSAVRYSVSTART